MKKTDIQPDKPPPANVEGIGSMNVSTEAEAAFERRMERVMESVDRHHACLVGYVASMSGPADAEDIVQDLWRHVLQHFDEGQIGSLPLLLRKSRQLFVDFYRRRRTRRRTLERIAEEPPPAETEQEASEAGEARLRENFFAEFPLDLSEEQRTVLWLHAREGLTFAELEERLSLPASTAHDWVAKGRAQLRKLLELE